MWANTESLLTVEDDDDNMLSTSKGKQKSITAQAHFSVNDKHYEIFNLAEIRTRLLPLQSNVLTNIP